MKRILSRIRSKLYKDSRGMSLVEVLCAVAILSLVSGIIGTVIVISTRTYNRGISETNIQQEAQLAANNIGDIVKDACSVIYGASGQKYTQNGEELDKDGKPYVPSETDPTAVKVGDAGVTELAILTNDKKQYTVKYYHDNYGSDGNPAEVSVRKTLWYEIEDKKAGDKSTLQLMAKDITAFTADTTKFKDNKTIDLTITVNDGDREIPMKYTMTARNEAGEGVEYTPTSGDPAAIIVEENDIVLVPGERYKVAFSAMGISEVEWDSSAGLEGAISMTDSTAELIVPKNLTDTTPKTVVLKEKDGTVSASVNVRIRKVNTVKVSHTVNTKNSTEGMKETAGTVYTFSANVSGSELAKNVAYDYDKDYKTAQAVEWGYKLSLDGGTTDSAFYNWPSYTSDGADGYNCDYRNDNADVINGTDGYIEAKIIGDDKSQVPKLEITLKKNLPADFKLTVRATSKHAKGENKAKGKEGSDSNYYAAGHGIDPNGIHYGEAVIEPRETVVNKNLEIILEPQQIGRIKLDMKGGLTSNLDFEYHDAVDLSSSGAAWNKEEKTAEEYLHDIVGTKTVYDSDTDEVVIKLGKNERGSGSTSTTPYTFTIDVKIGSSVKTTITVHVRRVDTVHIDAHINDKDKTTMDLRLRFNADTEVDNIIQYLIDAEDKNGDGEPLAYKAVTTRVKIEVLDKSGNVDDSLTQIAEWGTYEGTSRDKTKESGIIKKVKGKWDKDLKRNGKVVYRIENTKPARISHNGTMWNMEQTPELDIKPMGLGMGEKIRVTMEAMHPAGTNYTGEIYYDTEPVKDVYILEGQEIIGVAKKNEVIIVEPYQVNDKGKAMIIPLHLASSVKAVRVKLEGNDSNTRVLADDTSGGIATIVKPDDGKNEMNLGVNIARTEEGSTFSDQRAQDAGKSGKAGLIRMSITAYSETNDFKAENILDSIDVYLGVRRVTKVTITNKDAFVNKAGNDVITLKATSSGLEGTEYFDRQTKKSDDKYEPVWDSGDKYKSPYKLKWTLRLKNGTETEISNKSEYFSNVDFGSEDDKDKSQTIKFQLEKALPVGSQIRATSVHAGDKNGKAENRSELNYVKDIDKYKKTYPEGIVFDYIEVKDSLIVADGFKRGKDYEFIKDITNVRSDVFEWGNYVEQASFYQYRELDNGTWTKYHMMDSGATTGAWANYVPMSYLFRPDKEYAIEVVSVLYNKTDKLIYWPQDAELLEPGRGWAEAGFKLWKPTQEQWKKDLPSASEWYWPYSKYEECYDKVQKIPEVKQTFKIPKSEMYFNTRADVEADTMTVNGKVTSVGSESEPIRLNGNNGDTSDYKGFTVDLEITGYEMNTDQQCFRTIVQKKSGNQWVTLGYDDDSVIHDQEGFSVDSANPYISIYRTGNAQGLYRVVPVILAGEKTNHKIQWRDVTDIPRSGYTDMDVLFKPEYTTSEENYHLYDYNTGKYVIYFEFYR